MTVFRHPKTLNELKQLFILYEFEEEYGIKIKHRKYRDIPNAWWDIARWPLIEKSWKYQSKRKKQWKTYKDLGVRCEDL